ncbi:hypothetical protein D2Q93_05395 [Alicyclobacillaceae bacterium I2511]|nr:hypothetical protein D2Q93_05395 [Alicyclobacillaceae bacterium I2511]
MAQSLERIKRQGMISCGSAVKRGEVDLHVVQVIVTDWVLQMSSATKLLPVNLCSILLAVTGHAEHDTNL